MKIFSPDWAQALHRQINTDGAYAKSGAKWTAGKLALVLDDRAVILDLHQGLCHDALSADRATAQSNAAFIIEGSTATWQDVLAGNIAPLMGIMSGKLKLSKGSIGTLMPFAKAAVDLVESAKKLETDF